MNLDLNDAADNVTAFVKSRGSLVEGEPVVFYFKGLVFNSVDVPPEETGETSYFNDALFQFEGFNIAQFKKISDYEYQMLSRELHFTRITVDASSIVLTIETSWEQRMLNLFLLFMCKMIL